MIDLRSDLMGPRSAVVAAAMSAAILRPPAMRYGEDTDEIALAETLAAELGVEAVLLVPTCTMANQIAIRLHLPNGGTLAAASLAHIVTVEAAATALTGVERYTVESGGGHPDPASVEAFFAQKNVGEDSLVWLENTHMLSAGSVLPVDWQVQIAAACRKAGSALHLDGSRLWNAAVAQDMSMTALTKGCDTISISLNKAIGAPVGSVLAGSRAMIDDAVRLREALGGEWRPIGSIAAAARAALVGWRKRLETDVATTRKLAEALRDRLGDHAIQPAPSNLIFVNRPDDDAARFVEILALRGVACIILTPGIVRLAVHSGVRASEVATIVEALVAADAELAAI